MLAELADKLAALKAQFRTASILKDGRAVFNLTALGVANMDIKPIRTKARMEQHASRREHPHD